MFGFLKSSFVVYKNKFHSSEVPVLSMVASPHLIRNNNNKERKKTKQNKQRHIRTNTPEPNPLAGTATLQHLSPQTHLSAGTAGCPAGPKLQVPARQRRFPGVSSVPVSSRPAPVPRPPYSTDAGIRTRTASRATHRNSS